MSWPHFQHGDPVLRERVEGLEPARREEHEFYLDIEPQWGATLSAHAAFQFNVLVDRNSYSGFEKIEKRVVLPFLMLEEGVSGPNQIVSTKMENSSKASETANLSTSLGLLTTSILSC